MAELHSVSLSGTWLFERSLSVVAGGMVIDLASAPIPPGEYKLDAESTFGGIEVYLARNVEFVSVGGADFGGIDIHDLPKNYQKLVKLLKGRVTLPPEPPPHLTRAVEKPTRILLDLRTLVGGIDIYRV
jgi:hypothetical protein